MTTPLGAPVAPTLDPLDLASVKAWVEHPHVCHHPLSLAVHRALIAEVEQLRNRSIIQQFADEIVATRQQYLELLAAAFRAKCDNLDPRECELVEEHVGTEIRWHFRRRTP